MRRTRFAPVHTATSVRLKQNRETNTSGARQLGQRHYRHVEFASFQTGDIDYSAQVTKAKGLSPDGLVVSALYNEAGNVTRELRKQGMNQPIVAGATRRFVGSPLTISGAR